MSNLHNLGSRVTPGNVKIKDITSADPAVQEACERVLHLITEIADILEVGYQLRGVREAYSSATIEYMTAKIAMLQDARDTVDVIVRASCK